MIAGVEIAITPGFRTEGFILDTISIDASESAPMVKIQMVSNGWGFQDRVSIQVTVLGIDFVISVKKNVNQNHLVGVRIVLEPLLKIAKEL